MSTFAEIIDGLGGYAKVAEAIGVSPKTVSSMRTRNSVPPEYWPALARFAAASGKPEITVDALAELRPPRKPREVGPQIDVAPGESISRTPTFHPSLSPPPDPSRTASSLRAAVLETGEAA